MKIIALKLKYPKLYIINIPDILTENFSASETLFHIIK